LPFRATTRCSSASPPASSADARITGRDHEHSTAIRQAGPRSLNRYWPPPRRATHMARGALPRPRPTRTRRCAPPGHTRAPQASDSRGAPTLNQSGQIRAKPAPVGVRLGRFQAVLSGSSSAGRLPTDRPDAAQPCGISLNRAINHAVAFEAQILNSRISRPPHSTALPPFQRCPRRGLGRCYDGQSRQVDRQSPIGGSQHDPTVYTGLRPQGEVAERLKALAC
jgi:hypothetical protein